MKAPERSGNTLIVYGLMSHPLRGTIKDHLYSFGRYSGQRCFYLNLVAARGVPRSLLNVPFDMVVFHTSFLGARWLPDLFERTRAKAEPLKALGGTRVALPQDEFLHTDLLGDFLEDFEVDVVCSVAPESEWPTIYPHVDRDRTRVERVLTGYLDEHAVARMERMATRSQRPLDIVYRARAHKPWLGRQGVLKGGIAAVVKRAAAARGLGVDMSTREEDVLGGDDWYRFLASGKYTIGSEGGASMLDRDGTLKARVEAYLERHPDAGFDEVEAACFPGRDGSFGLTALSPRHLEACATRTCQVLTEGEYNGVLEAGRHYISLRTDLSNLDQVLDEIERDERRAELVEAAHRDVVASGRYTYAGFVAEVERAALGEVEPVTANLPVRARHRRSQARDRYLRAKVVVLVRGARAARRLFMWCEEHLPAPLFTRLRRLSWTVFGRPDEA